MVALASSPLFARSIDKWERAARSWLEDPDRDRGLMLLSVVVESDPVWGATTVAERLAAAFARAPNREHVLNRLAAAALAERPPTGFFRDFVLEDSGERKGVLDIKRGGLLPIEALARWADAAVLRDAFELTCALRMEHQVEQLRAGEAPDNLIDPKRLTPLTRTSLKEAFRAVAKVQRGIGAKQGFTWR